MDKQTFSEAVQRMERSLYRVAMSYTGNVPDAADAVQEALLRAWNRRDTLRDERYFDTWLMRVVINESKDAAAQEAARAAHGAAARTPRGRATRRGCGAV